MSKISKKSLNADCETARASQQYRNNNVIPSSIHVSKWILTLLKYNIRHLCQWHPLSPITARLIVGDKAGVNIAKCIRTICAVK